MHDLQISPPPRLWLVFLLFTGVFQRAEVGKLDGIQLARFFSYESQFQYSVSENLASPKVTAAVHGRQTGRQWTQWPALFFWAPKSLQMVTAAMKLRRLLLGRKVSTNLDSFLKSRDITLPTKVCVVKAMLFPVVVYGCGSWTIKKAERWRINALELWCWRRLLRVP